VVVISGSEKAAGRVYLHHFFVFFDVAFLLLLYFYSCYNPFSSFSYHSHSPIHHHNHTVFFLSFSLSLTPLEDSRNSWGTQ
ncbi:hypothetical protein VIGAN_09177700, partial [Vigna angularis var. angularis]